MNRYNNSAEQTPWIPSRLVVLLAAALAQLNGGAQGQTALLKLKGIELGALPEGAGGTDLQVVGNYVYLTWHSDNTNHPGGLEIFRVANPSKPVRMGGYESRMHANAVQVVGRYAYLAEGTAQTLTNDPGNLEIIDVSNPANPVRTGAISLAGRANKVRLEGNYAFVGESVCSRGTNLLGALTILDIHDPTAPVQAAGFETAGSVTSVDVSAGYAYIADGVTDLQLLDVNRPTLPQRVGIYLSDTTRNRCGFEAGGPANHVQVVGNLAFSAGENGLHVLDITDPGHPFSIGDNFCAAIQTLYVSGRYAYATTWSSVRNGFVLFVADASNPSNIVTVASATDWPSPILEVAGPWLYAATDQLLIFKVSERPAHTSAALDAISN